MTNHVVRSYCLKPQNSIYNSTQGTKKDPRDPKQCRPELQANVRNVTKCTQWNVEFDLMLEIGTSSCVSIISQICVIMYCCLSVYLYVICLYLDLNIFSQ